MSSVGVNASPGDQQWVTWESQRDNAASEQKRMQELRDWSRRKINGPPVGPLQHILTRREHRQILLHSEKCSRCFFVLFEAQLSFFTTMVQGRHRAFCTFDGGHISLFEILVKLPSIF